MQARGRPDAAADTAGFTLLRADLRAVLATLSPREAAVIRLRFGLDDGQARALDQIGRRNGSAASGSARSRQTQ